MSSVFSITKNRTLPYQLRVLKFWGELLASLAKPMITKAKENFIFIWLQSMYIIMCHIICKIDEINTSIKYMRVAAHL
jgi:hypothetical protein